MCIVMDCAHYACIELFVHMCRWHGCIQHVSDAAELINLRLYMMNYLLSD